MEEDKLTAWINKTLLGDKARVQQQRPQQKPQQPPSKPTHAPIKKHHFLMPKTTRPETRPASGAGRLRVIPLGGLDEVGKNMMVIEYIHPGKTEASDIIIVDMGFQFPEEDMLGIDYVIPDTSYLMGKLDKLRAVVITHGHLDHIGGIPYLYKKLGEPIFYSTKLTLGLIRKKLEEFKIEENARLHEIGFGEMIRLGAFQFELFRVNHSFPDSAGVIIRSPVGILVHTGDFKFDFTPADGKPADFAKIASLASEKVLALFSDSTNATKPGYTMSERQVGETLEGIVRNIAGRIIIATFSSSIGRIQQIIDAAVNHGRKVYLSGRSIVDNVSIARQLGYIKAPSGTLMNIRDASKRVIEDDKALIITTGSQGESLSALARMAMNDHTHIKLKKGDTVIFSSSPIIGNERAITTVVNNLCQMGVQAISNQSMDVHTTGHGNQEDLKLMINLVKPRYVVPIHGELYMRTAHGKLAESIGYQEKNVIVANNGSILEIDQTEVKLLKERVDTNYVMVEGPEVGNTSSQVLLERQIMARNGVLVLLFQINSRSKQLIHPPQIISRGFIYLKESQEVIDAVIREAQKAYMDIVSKDKSVKRGEVKGYIRSRLDKFIHKKIEKTPLIIPILVEK
ncbi:ribonuclease J [Candidatus Peregrinibacteria bacterium]|nr:ribonuclease J [Candidatus Peregrinibacteria bacterium]